MLKQRIETKLATPTTFIKRDGAKYPFETFKLEFVIHSLGLDDIKDVVLTKIMDKLSDKTVTAQEVSNAFRQSLNELGKIDAAKAYVDYRKKTLKSGMKTLIPRLALKK